MGPSNRKGRSATPTTREGRPAADSRRVVTAKAVGEVERSGIEACDYLLSRAGDEVTGAIVDLSEATHLDYRATALLVARRRVFRARGVELAVAAGSLDVRNILRASAGAELPVFSTVEEAQAYVRGDAELVTAGAGQVRNSRSVKPTRRA